MPLIPFRSSRKFFVRSTRRVRRGPLHWVAFAKQVLEAAHETTLWATVLNAQRGGSRCLLLTSLGGGAFGNDESWIAAALTRALQLAYAFDLDVRLVSYGPPHPCSPGLLRRTPKGRPPNRRDQGVGRLRFFREPPLPAHVLSEAFGWRSEGRHRPSPGSASRLFP